ncbi:MAG: hypothetical protein VKM97_04280 [Cyanobacteriota bacterium]|nr:hypothetical protein [Cyanobacteriota bacterium]
MLLLLVAGTPVERTQLSMHLDGNQKGSHCAFAGKSQRGVKPADNEFFGMAQQVVSELREQGTCNTAHVVSEYNLSHFKDAVQQAQARASASNGAAVDAGAADASLSINGAAATSVGAIDGAQLPAAALPPAQPLQPPTPTPARQQLQLQQDEGHACGTQFSCARDAGTKGATKDAYGIVGASCEHTVPLTGSLIDMHVNEAFFFHIIAILALVCCHSSLVAGSPAACAMYVVIDYACRMKSAWHKLLQRWEGHPGILDAIRLKVGWLHGATHSQACQVDNNMIFVSGSGRLVGEQQETVWSKMKVRWMA